MNETNANGELRALRLLTEELRAEPQQEIDWDRVESKLFAAIRSPIGGAETPPNPPSWGRSATARAFGFAAVAAAIALGLTAAAGGSSRPLATTAPSHTIDVAAVALASGDAGKHGDHELLALHEGDVVDASAGEVRFGRDGALEWSLAKGGRVHVTSMGSDGIGHVVALDRGSIHAEVVPRAASEGLVEAFAVEVESTRVAVHGTSFTVTRADDRVVVDVAHGAIAVGPTRHRGETTGHLMIGPSRAEFSFDGGSYARWLSRPSDAPIAILEDKPAASSDALGFSKPAAPSEPIALGPRPASKSLVATNEPAVAPPPSLSPPVAPHVDAPPPAVSVVLTSDGIRGGIERCLKQLHHTNEEGVKVVIGGALHLDVNEDGSIRRANVVPPLKPEFQECLGGAISGKMAPGVKTLDIPFSYAP